jgi:predicted DNA-binding protein (MmcQ/YjbR family)
MSRKTAERLRKFALSFPETSEAHPWGETAIKVKGKTFLFMRADAAGVGLSVKLPHSREFALDRPFCEPTRYGLGASGWVSAKFTATDNPPLDLLEGWIEESYRAVAPKRVLAALDGTDTKPKTKAKPKAKPKRARSPR